MDFTHGHRFTIKYQLFSTTGVRWISRGRTLSMDKRSTIDLFFTIHIITIIYRTEEHIWKTMFYEIQTYSIVFYN